MSEQIDGNLSLRKRMQICLRILAIDWKTRKTAVLGYFIGASIEIGGMILSIYATAKLGSLLAVFASTKETDGIWFWLATDTVGALAIGFGFLIMNYAKRMLYFEFVRWSTNNYLAAMCRLDLAEFYDNDMRNKLNKVQGGYVWQMPNLSDACLDLLYGIMRFLAITLVVAQITWWLVPLIALFLIPTLIGESRMAKMQWFVWDSKGDFRHIFWGLEYVIRQAKGQMELRSSQASKFVLSKINSMNVSFYKEQEGKYRSGSKLLIPTKVLELAGSTIGLVVVLRQFLAGMISLEKYFFLSGALVRIGGSLNNIFGTLSRMQEGLLLANSYFEIIDKKAVITDTPRAIKLSTGEAPSIKFENVSFTYPDQDEAVFENLNITIGAGEHVAMVGENGAGKSTFIKLLLRFYRPTSGVIRINDVDLQDIAIESWYSLLATLFQDFNQYPLSIAENIEIGRSNQVTDKKMLKKAGEFGNVNELVKNYTHGWDTVLDSSFEKGIEPSGGQWQRVALARAFYRNANMIILDEPTSAIDAKAEYDIFNNIFTHYGKQTALIISHRFSTVRRADRIIVLEHGKVIETGSHKHLMKKQGLYHELFTKQAEGYKD